MADVSCASLQNRQKTKYSLDRTCFRRFKLCVKVIFNSCFSDASLLFIVLLGLCLGQQLVIYNVGLIPSEFMEVLGNKDKRQFKTQLIKSFCLIMVIALCNSLVQLVTGYLYLTWRKALTGHLHNNYFHKSNYYIVNILDNTIDNVDQRITQDVDRFCQQLSTISAKVVISPLTIVYYSYQCFDTTGYVGPLVIYLYFLLGTVTTKIIMSFIVNLVYKQEKFEGDFRYKHSQIRFFAESIAVIKSGKNELQKTNGFFSQLFRTQQKIVHFELFLNFFTGLIDYIGSILSYVTIGVPIFAGSYNDMTSVELSSLISKNAFVSIYLISCFSSLIDLANPIADLSGYTHRIGELLERFYLLKEQSQSSILFQDDPQLPKDVIMKIENLSYGIPNSEMLLVNNLNVVIKHGCNILVTGNTGIGKSSLIRILSKLWIPSSGKIRKSMFIKHIMYIPQQPVLTNGSLVDQIIYPKIRSFDCNTNSLFQKVEQALDDVGLGKLIKRIGNLDQEPEWSWRDGLSPGEIQRIAFARVFYHRPSLVVLDEATSSLDISEEECFYNYCQHLGITVLSIGHRESLKQYHDICLKIKGDGSWEAYDLK